MKYSHREPGFLRMSVWIDRISLFIKLIDTRKYRPIYSDRFNSLKLGPFMFRIGTFRSVFHYKKIK